MEGFNKMESIIIFFLNHWGILSTVILILIGVIAWQFGLVIYIAKISTPIGDFLLNNQASTKETITDSSRILPGSIYSTLHDLYYMQGTSLERKNLFEKYKGFQVKDKGKVVDIRTDGKTVVIEGSNNEKNASLICLFQDKWEKRIGIMKTGDEITFKGIISGLNIHSLVYLSACEISDQP